MYVNEIDAKSKFADALLLKNICQFFQRYCITFCKRIHSFCSLEIVDILCMQTAAWL